MSDKYDDAVQDQGEVDRRFLQLEGRTLTLDQLKALPPPAPMINDYLFKRTVAWLHGRWGSFKSFVAVDMACCVATGIPWHGHDVAQGNVLYLAAEGSQGLGQRFEAWEKHHRNPDMDRLKVLPMPAQLAEMDGLDVPAIIMLVKQFNTDLLILDTQARVTTGKDENSGRDMSVFTSHLSEIVEATGCTILVIHHEPRRGDNLRGHSSLEGAADTILRTELQSETTITLQNTKHKDAELTADMTMNLVKMGESAILAHDDPNVKRNALGEPERKVLNVLAGFTNGEATATEFVDAVVPDMMSRASFFRVRNKLDRKLKVSWRTKGNSKVWYVTDWAGVDPDAV
jgi:RecA-family ATPase